MCEDCLQKVTYVRAPLCSICGRDYTGGTSNDHPCEQCLRTDPPFSMVRSITYYEEPVKTLLRNLKYRFDTTTVAPLGKIARSFDFSPFEDCDIVIPVPLHISQLKKRGMNQALVLARLFFFDNHDKIDAGILIRNRPTVSQTQLDVKGRRKNIKAAFSVQNIDITKNKRICLVDDIYTTGITVRECAAELRRAGVIDVKVITMARVRLFN